MVTTVPVRRGGPDDLVGRADLLEAEESSLFSRGMRLWLLGTVALLPVRFLQLPFNMELVDLWILVGLPVAWIHLIRCREPIPVAYALPLGLILFGSLVSMFGASKPSNSVVVIVKELFLFAWFTTLTPLFARLTASDLRRLLRIWSTVAVLHGILMLAQFLSPAVWRMSAGLGGGAAAYANFRPSGLFLSEAAGDANFAALFQLMGFVPLLLMSYSTRLTIVGGGVLLFSLLVTGSMGAALAFVAGLGACVLGVAFLVRRFGLVWSVLPRLVIAAVFLGSVFYLVMASNPDSQDHFEQIFFGRSERSSEGRFDLWKRGIDLLVERDAYLWGVGPENFRVVGGRNKQPHNDLMAFVVERGLFGGLGLFLLLVASVARAIQVLRMYAGSSQRPRLEVVVLLAALVGLVVESLTHQIFHARELWLVLALQEGMRLRLERGRRLEWGF